MQGVPLPFGHYQLESIVQDGLQLAWEGSTNATIPYTYGGMTVNIKLTDLNKYLISMDVSSNYTIVSTLVPSNVSQETGVADFSQLTYGKIVVGRHNSVKFQSGTNIEMIQNG